MKNSLLLLLLCLSFTSISQDLQFFDREMIVEYKIKSIRQSIYDKEREKNGKNSCSSYLYRFDRKGNILTNKIEKEFESYLFEYNNLNKLVNYYWTDKMSKPVINFKESFENQPELFVKIIANYQNVFDEFLNKKSKIETSILRGADGSFFRMGNGTTPRYCLIFYRDYSLIIKEEVNGLLSELVGTVINNDINNKKKQSPKQLYIYYDYEFYD